MQSASLLRAPWALPALPRPWRRWNRIQAAFIVAGLGTGPGCNVIIPAARPGEEAASIPYPGINF